MFRERKFRFNVWALGIVFTTLLVGTTLLLNPPDRWLWVVRRDALHLISLAALIWLFCGVLWALFPVFAGPDGLRATDGLGRFHDVPWDDITRVTSVSDFYWIRHGKWGKALCFPKFLEDKKGFREYVVQHAPEGNPLREYLQRP